MAIMLSYRKDDVWAVLRFALRFALPKLQAACLVWLNSTTKGRLLWHADTVVAVTEQHCLSANAGAQGAAEGKAAAGGAETAGSGSSVGSGGKIVAAAARQLPVIEMLERDLLAEQQPAGLKQLGSYVAAAERLRLVRLRDGLLQAVAGQWSALATGQPQLVSDRWLPMCVYVHSRPHGVYFKSANSCSLEVDRAASAWVCKHMCSCHNAEHAGLFPSLAGTLVNG
jgi:hypothetical protein